MSLKKALAGGKFVVTAEVAPPKGTDIKGIIEITRLLRKYVSAINVTDEQGAVMRLGSLAGSCIVKKAGGEPVLQMACRDRNRLALQSDLLSAWVLGIEDVLAVTGDLPQNGDHPGAKPVYDLDSVQLLEVIAGLNAGHDMNGNPLLGKTGFFPGAVVNPGADTEAAYELQLLKFEKKVESGARFFQTQAIFEAATLELFMKRVARFNVPVLAGIVPLKSAGMARYMNKNIPGIHVPDELIERMAGAEDKTETGIQIAAGLIRQFQGHCAGVHVLALGWEKNIPAILAAAGV